ncbi:MAG: ATP-binding cassette domain-containing protein, partial [Alphaproteobacteria bacterium]|nr:ATP-binding cassette domain-containing protein [Alphaproteobacteria bacterium]
MSSESPSPDRNGTVDLFNALLVASRFLGGSPANRAILRDLPLEQGKLTTTHIAAAAAKLDLTVTTVPASLARLRTPYALPSILVPKKPHARAITLVKKNRRGFHGCFSPQSPTFFVPNKAIAAHSHALLLKPNFVLDQRSALLDFPDTVAWLRVPLMRNSPVYGLAVLASLCINLFAVAITFFVMAVYDRVTPNNSIESLIVLVAGISTVLVFDFTMKMLRAYMIDRAGQRFDITVGAGIFRKLLALRSVARPHSAGATANLVREFDSVRDFFTSATLVTLADLPFLLMFVGIIWLIGGKIVIVVLVAIPLVLLASLLLHWRLRPLIRENFRDGAQKSAFLHEIAVGIDSVKLANAQGWARRRYEALTLSASQSSLRTRLYSQGSTHFTALCVSGVTVGVVSVGALQIIAGELTVGALIASTMLSSRAMAPLTQISSLMAKWNHTRTAVKALDDLMSAETEHDASPLSGFITRDMVEGDIKLVGVDFAYPSHTGRSISSEGRGHSLFENLSLHITAGESIGVLGRIGSGKTTLLHLMSNLHQP